MGNRSRARIGDLCEIIKGETGLASAPPGEYPLVATGADRRSCATWQFDTDAVCIPLVSSTGHGKKTLNYVHYQSGKFALGTILAAVIPKDPSILTARFLHLYLSHFKDTVLVPLMKGAANVSLPMKEIASVEIPVPPLEEQQNLIDLIFRIEDEHRELLAETNRQGDLLKQLRQAVLQEAVEGKLTTAWRKQHPVVKGDPQYDAAALLAQIKTEKERLVREGKIRKEKPLPPIAYSDKPFDLPDGWAWCRLGEVIELISGQHIETNSTNTKMKGLPYLTGPADFGSVSPIITKWTESPKVVAYENDILITVKGSGVGKTNILDIAQAVISRQLMAVRPQMSAIYNFTYLFIQSIRLGLQDAKDGLIPGISRDHLLLSIFPLPPLAEQQAIAASVDNLMAVTDELEKQVAERKEQAQLLMQTVLREAFSGT